MRTTSDLCHLLHKPIGFYNWDEKCLLRGKDWVFKYSRLHFVFKGLNNLYILCRSNEISSSATGTQLYQEFRTDIDT